MCGIAGMLSKDIDLRQRRELAVKIGSSLRLRGPDGAGYFTKPYISLIHRRLAVIDPENGAQPMSFGKYTFIIRMKSEMSLKVSATLFPQIATRK